MMKAVFVLAAVLTVGGCSSFELNPYNPTRPETAAGQAAAEQAREASRILCGPTGQVSQRDDTDGTRAQDWNCERPKPR